MQDFIPYDKAYGLANIITLYSLLDILYCLLVHDIHCYLGDQSNIYENTCLVEHYKSLDKETPNEIMSYMVYDLDLSCTTTCFR